MAVKERVEQTEERSGQAGPRRRVPPLERRLAHVLTTDYPVLGKSAQITFLLTLLWDGTIYWETLDIIRLI